MATMIPDSIDQNDPRLDGERMVFSWLSSNKIEGVVLHSLLQKNHKHKFIGEVDFLLICKRGILCIEVKGGQEILRREGKWLSQNKRNQYNEIKDPFRQANDCMYALKEYLGGKYTSRLDFMIGYAVIFPECMFTGKGNDLVTEVLFDCRFELLEFPQYINNTFDYWENLSVTRHNFRPAKMSKDDETRIKDFLRGDFAVVPSMNLTIQHIEQKLLQLTEDQYDVLEITNSNKRVLISGVAGTGKSLLAIEKARRALCINKKVLYICFNNNMSKLTHLTLQDYLNKNSFVGTFHNLAQSYVDIPYYYSISEIGSMIKGLCSPKYDCLIIDEAQDLMNISVLESLGNLLVGGLENGEWVMFYDPNQNLFNNNDEFNFAQDYIKEAYRPTISQLFENCRNTEQIGRRISVITNVSPAKYMRITGPKVVMTTYKNSEECNKEFKKQIKSLLTGGTPASDIVILSKHKLCNSILSELKTIHNLPVIETTGILNFKINALNFFTVQSFKGLESKVVFMVDVDGFTNEQDRMNNYVGMSRAKILLYVFYPANKKEEYISVTTENAVIKSSVEADGTGRMVLTQV